MSLKSRAEEIVKNQKYEFEELRDNNKLTDRILDEISGKEADNKDLVRQLLGDESVDNQRAFRLIDSLRKNPDTLAKIAMVLIPGFEKEHTDPRVARRLKDYVIAGKGTNNLKLLFKCVNTEHMCDYHFIPDLLASFAAKKDVQSAALLINRVLSTENENRDSAMSDVTHNATSDGRTATIVYNEEPTKFLARVVYSGLVYKSIRKEIEKHMHMNEKYWGLPKFKNPQGLNPNTSKKNIKRRKMTPIPK